MLEVLTGSIHREKVLLFLHCRKEGYAREIARYFNIHLSQVQKQLERLERGNVIVSKQAGKTCMYRFNPGYPFLQELQSLLDKVLSFYPVDERDRLILNRRRPRRKGKPL
jgi:predicted transcriptional regulator